MFVKDSFNTLNFLQLDPGGADEDDWELYQQLRCVLQHIVQLIRSGQKSFNVLLVLVNINSILEKFQSLYGLSWIQFSKCFGINI